ncbi:MFS transporter [Sphingomonas immobilis]|uniref:MFS transporter n=1 Tax=Sphingomonas immobilis TaxID=3063997 RepID=A0ABT8ZZX3_9SPHN|nr:MFS transporter [Sphingomonas sp. CA1-15]MDO7842301.1 MFS transporter [Sphingomonas sp. CA1-15]
MTASTASSDPSYPAARIAWTAVGVLLLLYALAFIDRQIIALMVAPIRADLGISDFQIGLLQGFAFALLYALFGLPLGLAVDRLSRRRVIFVGVFVWALAATACGLARTYPELLAARVLVGAGEAALAPAAYSILSDLFPKKRLTLALGVFAIGAQLGASSSLAIGGLIIEAAKDGVTLPLLGHVTAWRFAFIVTGAPGILLAFLVFLIPEPARRGAGAVRGTWRELFAFLHAHGRFFACHFLGFACIMAMAYSRLAWLPAYFTRHFGWPIGQTGIVLAVFTFVTGALALPITGAIVDRWYARGVLDAHMRFYVWGGIAATVTGAGCFLMPNPTLFFALSTIAMIPMGMVAIAAGAIQIVTPPTLRGRMSAIYLLFVALFALTVGPGIVGLFTDLMFKDDALIHLSLAVSVLALGPVATIAFVLGLAPMRRAVEAARARGE